MIVIGYDYSQLAKQYAIYFRKMNDIRARSLAV